MNPGSFWRGRGLPYDPDARAIEGERQRWVMERIGGLNEAIVELAVDPAQAYALHRGEYVRTGDLAQLRLALEYVR